MKTSKFSIILNNRLEKIKAILYHKAKEYASNADRLHNFKVAAKMLNCSPAGALMGMKVKHDVSVLDLVRNPDMVTPELIEEKIGDSINYLILLEALLLEGLENE